MLHLQPTRSRPSHSRNSRVAQSSSSSSSSWKQVASARKNRFTRRVCACSFFTGLKLCGAQPPRERFLRREPRFSLIKPARAALSGAFWLSLYPETRTTRCCRSAWPSQLRARLYTNVILLRFRSLWVCFFSPRATFVAAAHWPFEVCLFVVEWAVLCWEWFVLWKQ